MTPPPAPSAAAPVALVTGAPRRIGRAIALRLAGQGFALALHARRPDDAQAAELRCRIAEAGGRAVLLDGDLADPGVASGLVARAAAALGPVTLAVNNASLFEADAAADFPAAGFDRHMATNLRAPLLIAQALAAQGTEGCVVNIVDQRVWRLTPDFFTYTLSKSALWTATRTMAQAFAPRVRVNAVAPGPTLPNAHEGEAGLAREIAALPLGRGPSPEEIADAVVWLAAARSVTGQMIAVDGGQHLGPA
ncbi:MAG: SDR family oxidoreductase [Rhizobiales bacterium]|nr:SDR family oxidoreductase [Hyphomicrobiales bacterium]